MKAYRFDELKLDALKLHDEAEPRPQRGEVVVRVRAAVGDRVGLEALSRAMAATKLKPIVDKAFAFAEAREAFAYLESGAHFGKVVIRVGS